MNTFENKSTSIGVPTANGRSLNFLSSAPRFIDQKKLETPGPGHYSNEDLNNWFKRTYNMIFTE